MIVSLVLTFNNFFHDFAAAMWVASILIVYFLNKQASGKQKETSSALLELAKLFRKILVASVGVIFATGVLRTITYNFFIKQATIHTYSVLGKHFVLILLAILSFVYVWRVIGQWQDRIPS